MSLHTSGRRRLATTGFTLVEMLVVITIIGMLMAMLSVAVWKALEGAKRAKMIVEVDQLSQAIQSYKEQRQQFPPCMAQINVADRKVRFMRHIQVAFANANYGTAAGTFDTIRSNLMTGTGITFQPYNFQTAGGEVRPLDLNTLDQAEALVFWLGGFPTPYNSTSQASVANRRIFGFHRDSDAPFRRDAAGAEGLDPLRYRTDPFYQFDDVRLADQDEDGWLEYLPLPKSGSATVAPFVYFDSDSYSTSSTGQGSALDISIYGYPRNGDPGALDLAGQFGLAVPMATFLDPSFSNPMRWANPEGFQIICAGLDGLYSNPIDSDLLNAYRVPVFPKGDVYSKATSFTEQGGYSIEEQDNLTNLSTNSLEGARQEAGR